MDNSTFTIGIMWMVYYLIHSLLAASSIKRALGNHKLYRLTYSALSCILLIPIVLSIDQNQSYLFHPHFALSTLGIILTLGGLVIVLLSFQYFSSLEFIGLKPSAKSLLIEKGLHRYVRHPIYSGTILVFAGLWFSNPTTQLLATTLVTLIYLPIGIFFEEKKLVTEFGKDYLEYKSRVPAIFPNLFF